MTVRFRVGDTVKVSDLGKAGHIRTPFYVRGKVGEVSSSAASSSIPRTSRSGTPPVPSSRFIE